jgi:hypothetical protein
MGGQQKNFICDIVFFQHQNGMRKKVRRHFLQCTLWDGDVIAGPVPTLFTGEIEAETKAFLEVSRR